MKATVIGLGLIGGSFALSLKDKGLYDSVMGIEHSEKSALRALELGLVEKIVSLDEALEQREITEDEYWQTVKEGEKLYRFLKENGDEFLQFCSEWRERLLIC